MPTLRSSLSKNTKGRCTARNYRRKDKAETLKRGILKKNETSRVEVISNDETIYVSGIDGDVAPHEIECAVRASVRGNNTGSTKVVSTRPKQYGSQNATIVASKDLAKELIKKGRIKIGWTLCHIRPRVNLVRCYRCLLYGHYKSECQGEDKKDVCFKCRKSDHRAKDCSGASYCLACKVDGHRADQTKCPYYRKLLRDKAREMTNGNRKKAVSADTQMHQHRNTH